LLYDMKYHYHNHHVSAHGICIAAQFGLSVETRAREVCSIPVCDWILFLSASALVSRSRW
jgi:hypothetical protein